MSQAVVGVKNTAGMMTYTRTGRTELERPYEKPVIVPAVENNDVATHAWADARFATDIMAEHAFFFALLMPEELAPKERAEALHESTHCQESSIIRATTRKAQANAHKARTALATSAASSNVSSGNPHDVSGT